MVGNHHKKLLRRMKAKLVKALKKLISYKERRFLDFIFNTYIDKNERAHEIRNFKPDGPLKDLLGERELPGDECFQDNGWWKYMLLRYGLAMHFSEGKDVLETCSGLGWGAYLLDSIAKSVTCIEIDRISIDIAKKIWKTGKTKYLNGSVLEIPVKDNQYDVVTAMESIEHFDLDDISLYLSEIYRVLKPGGYLIGSSTFPITKEEADKLCSENKYHLHVCTQAEIKNLLSAQGFRKIKILQNRLFFISKK